MARTVTAFFTSRGEAETARARLAAVVKVEWTRVIAQDTAGALVGLPIEPNQLNSFREALACGDHLVVAAVERGADPELIVSALSQASRAEQQDDGPRLPSIDPVTGKKKMSRDNPRHLAVEHVVAKTPAAASPIPVTGSSKLLGGTDVMPIVAPAGTGTGSTVDEVPPPLVGRLENERRPVAEVRDEIRIGEQQVARPGGGAHPIDSDAQSGHEDRAPARRLSDEEVRAGGLLKERVIEFIEMREEPVISREVVVREEVIISKTVNERTETFNETDPRTDVEAEELQPPS